jgi:hypothetical protein
MGDVSIAALVGTIFGMILGVPIYFLVNKILLWGFRKYDLRKYAKEMECDCSVHDITTPGAAHADDCPRYD